MFRIAFLILFIFFVSFSCSLHSVFSFSGTIEPIKTKRSCSPEDFDFTSDSHAVVSVYYEKNSEAIQTVLEERIDGITSFPISFSLDFSPSSEYQYYIQASVFSRQSSRLHIGDLTTESAQSLEENMILKVSCVEDCDDKNAGGICSNLK